MVFVEEAACPDWQTSETADKNDEVIHYIHGWWLRDVDLSAKGSCPSAGCGMSCAEGWQLPLDVRASLCGAEEFDPGEQSAGSLFPGCTAKFPSSLNSLQVHQDVVLQSRRTSQQLSSLVEKQRGRGNLTCPRNSCPAVKHLKTVVNTSRLGFFI